MSTTKTDVKKHLDQLIGLPLCMSHRAADTLVLQFGTLREIENRSLSGKLRKNPRATVGDFSLHIQCPWRIENADGIITGRGDLYRSADTGEYFDKELDDDSFYEHGKNFQDRRMSELLQGIEPVTDSYMNVTDFLIVEATEADNFGEATIYLSGGYRLRIFPSSSKGEHWRLLQGTTDEKHFVVDDSEVTFE